MEFKTLEVAGMIPALHGMRNPKKSWEKGDSMDCTKCLCSNGGTKEQCVAWDGWVTCNAKRGLCLGPNDLKLAQELVRGGSEHRKFLRMINVWVNIEAPQYFLAELDTYKIATTRNSSSLQHMGSKKDFELADFELDPDPSGSIESTEGCGIPTSVLTPYLTILNRFRKLYNDTKNYTYFRILRQILPMSYKYQITYHCNYETILTAYLQRRNHKLEEWSGKDQWNTNGTPASFVTWAETLPYFKDICLLPLNLI